MEIFSRAFSSKGRDRYDQIFSKTEKSKEVLTPQQILQELIINGSGAETLWDWFSSKKALISEALEKIKK